MAALGLIEAVGLTTAITALDAAAKAADITLVGYDKVIGAGKSITVTIHMVGDVAAVQASVEAGVMAASKIGTILSHRVIPRPHDEVDKLIDMFKKNLKGRGKNANNDNASNQDTGKKTTKGNKNTTK